MGIVKEDIEKAKQYLSNEGYGTGSNFTVNAVANLMAEWSAKNCTTTVVKSCCLDPQNRKLKNSENGVEWYCGKCSTSIALLK